MSMITPSFTSGTTSHLPEQNTYKEKIQKLIKDKTSDTASLIKISKDTVPVIEQIDSRRKELENTAFEQDIRLKKGTFFYLVLFLVSETILIFVIAFFQGLHPFNFHLEEWTFKLLVTATISQITAMFFIVVKNLFPNK